MFVFPESVKEDEWLRAVNKSLHPGTDYMLVKHVRLVGMMLIVYVKTAHLEHVSSHSPVSVGIGIMGNLGNKVCVSIRFTFHSTNVCMVNSHSHRVLWKGVD